MSAYSSLTAVSVRRRQQISLIQNASIERYWCAQRNSSGPKGRVLVVPKRELSSDRDPKKPAKEPSDRVDDDKKDIDVSVSEDHEKVLTIPNALTMTRIVSSPYIGYLIVQQEYGLALAGCIVFGLTDALDGYIARKYNMRS
ncbi:hypothetical protein EV175_007654, partial [Coemansia sp. RSA 1933]